MYLIPSELELEDGISFACCNHPNIAAKYEKKIGDVDSALVAEKDMVDIRKVDGCHVQGRELLMTNEQKLLV